jgi:beta-fructofuranosidase
MLEIPDKWIWDSWYARDGDLWHGFFLQADRTPHDPDLRHWNVSMRHATSEDLTHWTDLGTCFRPSEGPAWDDYTTWTGSVVRGDDGRWHLFYTGASRAEQGLKQRIGHAVSDDLHAWTRVGTGPVLDLAGPWYELEKTDDWHDRAMRDPWVMRDPGGAGWLMYFTARVPGSAAPNARGTIGLATSPDLAEWTLQPPVHAGGQFGQLEVAQVFEIGGRWYCLFCTGDHHWSDDYAASYPGAPVTGTHYLIADNPRGPWTVAPGPFLDGSTPHRRYAARILDTGEGMVLLGFLAHPDGAPFTGVLSDPDPVIVDDDGLLRLASAGGFTGRHGGNGHG